MPFNGSGAYILPATTVSPAVASTLIESAEFNTMTADLASALTNTITKDGQTTVTANLPMATYRHTGAGDAVGLQDYATANQVVDNTLIYCGASAVGTDAYAVTATITPGAYVTGSRFLFKADVANAGACTLDISNIGATAIKDEDGNDPADNSILANQFVDLIYDGTNLVLQNPAIKANKAIPATTNNLSMLTASGDLADSLVETNGSGNPSLDTSGGQRSYGFDTGAKNTYLYGDASGDVGLYDFTNTMAIWTYDEGLSQFVIAIDVKHGVTNGDLNFVRNGTGDITIDSIPVYGMVVLDTPQQLVNASTTNGAWSQIDFSALGGAAATAATAGAVKAILRFTITTTEAAVTSTSANIYIRKRGSALAIGAQTQIGSDSNESSGAATLLCSASGETIVNLDANSDCDWYSATTGTPTTDIYLVGYYV